MFNDNHVRHSNYPQFRSKETEAREVKELVHSYPGLEPEHFEPNMILVNPKKAPIEGIIEKDTDKM